MTKVFAKTSVAATAFPFDVGDLLNSITKKITKQRKVKVFIFKCLIVQSVTRRETDCFLNANMHFIARRSILLKLSSDNETHFVGANGTYIVSKKMSQHGEKIGLRNIWSKTRLNRSSNQWRHLTLTVYFIEKQSREPN